MARNLTKAPSCTKTHTIFSHIYCREQISTISVFFLIEQDTIQVDENIANICETRVFDENKLRRSNESK